MPNPTASADGEAMPAESLTSRRAAIGALACLPVLAIPNIAIAAVGDDQDKALFELLVRWRSSRVLSDAAEKRFSDIETAARVEPPAVLIKTDHDHHIFCADKGPIGYPFEKSAIEFFADVIGIISPIRNDSFRTQRLVDRYIELRDACERHSAAVEAARQSTGYYEAEADLEAALSAESELRIEVANARARTIPGLLAKLRAVAESFGPLSDIEQEADFDGVENVTLDGLLLTVLRDGAVILGHGKEGEA